MWKKARLPRARAVISTEQRSFGATVPQQWDQSLMADDTQVLNRHTMTRKS